MEQVELEIEESGSNDSHSSNGEKTVDSKEGEDTEAPFVEVVSKTRRCQHTCEEHKAIAKKHAR